jgi:hypothetical protein
MGGDDDRCRNAQFLVSRTHFRSLRSIPSTLPGMAETQMTGSEWIRKFADELGVEPLTDDEVEALLDLAGVAAHASERLAAPLTCYLVGRAGIAPTDALHTANTLAAT